MHFTTSAIAAVGLFGINVAAQGLGQTAICPFDGNRGPNILLAVVQLPDGSTEIDAWLYGYNWCSHSNFVSATGDICADTGNVDTVEFMHAPFTNKFGAFDPICYANIEIQFYGCEPGEDGGQNYDNVVAWITSKPPDQITNNAVDAAPNFGPQRGQFGQPPQGAIPMAQAGPQSWNGQSGYQQGGQQSGGQSRGQFDQSNNVPSSLNSAQNSNPQAQNFNPQAQGINQNQQGQFSPQSQQQQQQQGQFPPQQQSQSGGRQGSYGGGQPGSQQPGQWGGQQQVSYLYQCVDDREHRGCVYNSQIDPPSETKYTAFLSCGVMAEP